MCIGKMAMEDDINLNPYGVGMIVLMCVIWSALIYFRS